MQIIIAGVLAFIATVLACIFIVPDKKRATLNKFGKFLHDTVNFKYLIIEKILQALYIFATALVIILGFLMLFSTTTRIDWRTYRTYEEWAGGYGILVMILGPIAVRLAYEGIMMFILLIKNVIQINNKLRNFNDNEANDIFKASLKQEASVEPAATAQNEAKQFCTNCGAVVTGDFCTNCGAKR